MLTPFENKNNTDSNICWGNRSLQIRQFLLFQVVKPAPNLRLKFKNKTTSPKASPQHSSLDGVLLTITEYHGLGTLGLWPFGCSGELKNKDSYMGNMRS